MTAERNGRPPLTAEVYASCARRANRTTTAEAFRKALDTLDRMWRRLPAAERARLDWRRHDMMHGPITPDVH